MKLKIIVCGLALCLCAWTFAANQDSDAKKDALKKEVNSDIQAQLNVAKKELAELLTKYGEKHPNIVAQRQKITRLEAQLAKLKREKG